MWGGHAWRARGAPAYNRIWGQSPQQGAGFRAEPLVRELGAKPPEAENLLAFGAQRNLQIWCLSVFWKLSKPQVIVIPQPPPPK